MTSSIVAATPLWRAVFAWEEQLGVIAAEPRDQITALEVWGSLLDICVDAEVRHHALPERLKALYWEAKARVDGNFKLSRGYFQRYTPSSYNLTELRKVLRALLEQSA